MERTRRLLEFWSWLPAFRAVAETEHLPTASRLLGVSPSALSRSIRLLETRLGTALFRRVGRRIQLNGDGEEFLSAIRDAMRRIDDGLLAIAPSHPNEPVLLSASGFVSDLILPAIKKIQSTDNPPVIHLGHHPRDRVNDLLLRGQLDVAFLPDPTPHRNLQTDRIGILTNGVYCGHGHPLFKRRRPSLEATLEHAFVAPPPEASPFDNWPVDLPRQVALYSEEFQVALEAATGGRYLAVLPDVLVRKHSRGGKLRRLSHDVAPPTCLYATCRHSLRTGHIAQTIIEAVRAQLKKTLGQKSH